MSTLHRTVLIIRGTHPLSQEYENWLQPDFQAAALAWDENTGLEARSGLSSPLPVACLVEMAGAQGDGAAVIHALKAQWGLTCPPVMVVGPDEVTAAVAAVRAGAADYLVQEQLTPAQLRAAVQQAIAPPPEAPTSAERCAAQGPTSSPSRPEGWGMCTAGREAAGQLLALPTDYLQPTAGETYKRSWDRQSGQRLCEVEVDLRASQQRYSELAEAMPQIVWSADAAGYINYWNQRWYEYTGLSDENSLGVDGVMAIHPEERDRTLQQWQQATEARATFEVEYRLRHREGHYRWFICRAVPTGDGPGQITGWIGTITDIHDRKQLEQQLRQEIADHQRTEAALRSANDRITGILENMTDAYIAVDASWRITYVNQLAARINQVSPTDLLHREYWEVWPDADGAARGYCEQAIATGAPVHFEQFNAIHQRWFEIHACPAADGLGIYFRDVHDRKQADLERQQYQETICQQLAEIEAIYQSAPIGLNVLDPDLRFRRINQRLAEINGLPIEAHLGRTIREVLPDLADTAEQVLLSILETGEPLFNIEIQGETPAQPGVKRTWLEHFIPLKQGDRIIGINTVCEEITERKQAEGALQLTKERFELAARAVKCLIYEWDLLSGLVERTYGLKELVGYPPEEAEPTADWWANRIHPDDRHRLYTEAFWDKIQTADRMSSEYRVRHRQGHYLWVQDHLLVVRDDAGQPVKIVGSSADITYRKQAELALQEAHIQLEAALAAGAVYTWRWSLPDNRVYTNRSFAHLFGVDPQGASTGLPMADFLNAIHPEDAPRVTAAIEQAIATGEEFAQEYRICDADGQEHWVIARGQVEYDERGQAIGFPGALADITAHKQTEIALRANEARLQGFVDANVVGILQGDIYGKIVQANDELLRILGYSQADLAAGRISWIDLTPPEYLPLDQERIAEAQERGACTPYEKEYVRRDGSRVPVLIGYSLVGAAREESVGFVLDLTERKQAEKALRRSEDRLRLAIESAQLGTWDWHLLTQWLTWDERCKTMFGLPPSHEVNLEMFLAAVHPADRQRVEQLMAAALSPAQAGQYEAEFRIIGIQDRVERWIAAKGQVYFMADGTPKRFTGTALDITARKQAEVVLRDREERLELAASAARLGVFEWNIQADETMWENPQMYEIFGHDPAEGTLSKAQFMQSVVHPEDRRALEYGFVQALKKGRLQQQVCRIRRRHDGRWRWVEINGHLTTNPEGVPLRLIGVISDITARKQADENLRLSENRYRTLANAVSQLMWVNDAAGYVQFYNQQWEAYTGLEQLDLGVGLWANIIHPDDYQAAMEVRAQAIQAGESYAVECRLKRYDQTYRWHLARIVPFKDEADQVLSWFGTATDIHDRKCAEAEREELLEREQIAREEAERANRIKDEFLAILSHELRSPLNPILGWAKLLQTRNLDAAKTAQALATIERNAKLQTQLIDDLLDIAKILRGKLKLENAPVELGFAVESAIDTVQTAAAAKSIALQADLPDMGQVWGDFGRIQQIVWNLLTNAIKFTPEGGRVAIQLVRVDDLAQIRVTDTGKGIRPDFLPHIFDSFRQEDVSITRQHGGLGLGLAIVRYLVEAHGGTVTAASPGEGQGATFTVSLPLLKGTAQTAMPSLPNLADLNLSGVRVLAVDDNPDTCELLSMVCTQYGAEVIAVNSGPACLDHLSTFQPHILISDIGMPQMDGLKLIQAIRSRPAEQSGLVPAIALTAYTREVDQQRALASGFQKHLSKPIDIEQLVQVILALLPEKRA